MMEAGAQYRNGRIRVFDGFRGAAVLIVIFYHLVYWMLPENSLSSQLGRFGVELFFILSGYLITLLLLSEKSMAGGISLRNFFLRRAFKLIPSLYIFLAVYYLVFGFSRCSARGFLPPLTFTQQFFRHAALTSLDYSLACRSLNHTWSLNVEEVFYLIWAPMVATCTFVFSRQWGMLLLVVSGILRVLNALIVGNDLPHYLGWMPRIGVLPDLFGPLLGALLAYHQFQLPNREYRNTDTKWCYVTLLLSMVVIAACEFGTQQSPSFGKMVGYISKLGVPLLGLLIFYLVLTAKKSLMVKFLSIPAMTWLGRISYSVYLWQQPFTYGGDWVFGTGFLSGCFAVALSVGAGALSFYAVELPMQRIGRRYFPPRI